MSFSVDYQFTQGEPDPAGYVWVIERTRGQPARLLGRLAREGNLMTLIPGWRPEEGPFQTHIEDRSGKRLSTSAELR